MDESVVEKAIRQLSEAGLVKPGEIKGCAPEEIVQIEGAFHSQPPAIYKEFMVRMGKAAGQFMIGTDIFNGIASGTIAVIACAVAGSVTVLPAVLELLGPRIDRGHVARLGAGLGLDAECELGQEPGQRLAIDPGPIGPIPIDPGIARAWANQPLERRGRRGHDRGAPIRSAPNRAPARRRPCRRSLVRCPGSGTGRPRRTARRAGSDRF